LALLLAVFIHSTRLLEAMGDMLCNGGGEGRKRSRKNESDGRFFHNVLREGVEVGDVKWLSSVEFQRWIVCPTLASSSNDKGTDTKDHRITSLSLFAPTTQLKLSYFHVKKKPRNHFKYYVGYQID